jgi:HK97 family phage prohead protease
MRLSDTPYMECEQWKTAVLRGQEVRPIWTTKTSATTEKELLSDRQIKFTISTGARDRDQDTVDPLGWDLAEYTANPVVLYAHDYHSLPIGKALHVGVEEGKLVAVDQFVERDIYPFADTVYQLVQAGFLRATSVGFMPVKWLFNEEARGFDISAALLLEHSVVAVPSNPEALVQARQAGIDLAPMKQWAEETLDTWHAESGLWVPRKTLERVFTVLEGKTYSLPAAHADDADVLETLDVTLQACEGPDEGQDAGEEPGSSASTQEPQSQGTAEVLAEFRRFSETHGTYFQTIIRALEQLQATLAAQTGQAPLRQEDPVEVLLPDVTPKDVAAMIAAAVQEHLVTPLTGRVS